jgi:hypothetical protein
VVNRLVAVGVDRSDAQHVVGEVHAAPRVRRRRAGLLSPSSAPASSAPAWSGRTWGGFRVSRSAAPSEP